MEPINFKGMNYMKKIKIYKIVALIMIAVTQWCTISYAKIRVVTSLPSFGDIATNVGGDEVDVDSLTKGTQDPHFVDAKPSLILKLNKADLLIRAGLGLEDGWLPPLVTGARNAKIQNGGDGNLDASARMSLKEVPTGKIDRSQGDVHPGGNPHFMTDPRNGIVLAKAIAEYLSKIDPSKADFFKKRSDAYISKLRAKITIWEKSLAALKGKKVVTYHKSWIYFSEWVGLEEVGYLEPKPGVPPSPDHIAKLIGLMKQKNVPIIIMEPFYPKGVGEDVASRTSSQLLILPTEVLGVPEAKTYIDMYNYIVQKMNEVFAKGK
jgi:zinc/manganese transport system substrate-binding protein